MFTKIIDIERLIHSIKTVIACMVGVLFTKLFSPGAGPWIVISIIVVMCAQIYVGSVIQKSYLRFLGTIIGCLFATITLTFVGVTDLSIALTIALSSFIFSYFATGNETYTYTATLGAVTTTIIILYPDPTLTIALERFLEISLGLLIATLISQFVLPIHASDHMRREQANTLSHLRDYYAICMITDRSHEGEVSHQELDENIGKSLSKQRQLAKEATREPFKSLFQPSHFVQTLQYEKGILRSIDFMHSALIHMKDYKIILEKSSEFHMFNSKMVEALDVLIKMAAGDNDIKNQIKIPSITLLAQIFPKNIADAEQEELIYVNGFLFSAKNLLIYLTKLSSLYYVKTEDL